MKYPSSHRFTGLCALIPPQPLRPTPHSAHSSGCIFTPGCNFLSICFLRWTIDFTRTETVSCVCIVAQLCLTLCDPKDCNPPGSSVYGIFQARILEWVAIPPPGDLPHPGIELASLHSLQLTALAGKFFTTEPPGKPNTVVSRAQTHKSADVWPVFKEKCYYCS